MTTEPIAHEQSETLFDVPAPPVRKGARDYLAHLSQLRYADPTWHTDGWAFWALAPIHTSWRDHPVTLAQVEHVWLIQDRQIHQALIEVRTGEILRRRQYEERL